MHFEEVAGAKLFVSLSSYSSDYDVDIREKERQFCRYRDKTLLTIKRKKLVLSQPCRNKRKVEKGDVDISGVHCISLCSIIFFFYCLISSAV